MLPSSFHHASRPVGRSANRSLPCTRRTAICWDGKNLVVSNKRFGIPQKKRYELVLRFHPRDSGSYTETHNGSGSGRVAVRVPRARVKSAHRCVSG